MKPWRLMLLSFVVLCRTAAVDAQHCNNRYVFRGHWSPWVVAPVMGYSGFAGPGYNRMVGYQIGGYQANRVDPFVPDLTIPQPMREPSFLIPDVPRDTPFDPSKVPVVPSSPAARLRSLEHQARGTSGYELKSGQKHDRRIVPQSMRHRTGPRLTCDWE